MLTQIVEGVRVHESEFCQSNAVVVQGRAGVLLIDPGVHADEIVGIANELAIMAQTVVAGFSTHPHWDHLLWHASLGEAPRYATAVGAETARVRLAGGIDAKRFGIPDQVSLELLGDTAGLPAGSTGIPWEGPDIRIIEHRAHAPGHAALLIEEHGVLVAGDMLSDVLIPLLDFNGTTDPIGDYLDALQLFDEVAAEVQIVVPGHGSVGGPDAVRARIEQDRAYVRALGAGKAPEDSRIGPAAKPGWDWVSDVHDRQAQQLAQRTEQNGPPSQR